MNPVVWEPDAAGVEAAGMTAFNRWLRDVRGVEATDADALWRWSVDDLDGFWTAIWAHYAAAPGPVPERALDGDAAMPGTRWFPGTGLSYAERVLRPGADDDLALVGIAEDAAPRRVTRGELRERVARVAGGLRALGVQPGERVVAVLPNGPEAVIGLLACASLGVVWSSCSPDFGARSVLDRFRQLDPVVLLATPAYRYGGRDFDRRAVLAEVRAGLPTLRHVVTLGQPSGDDATPWATLEAAAPVPPEPLPFDHPLWVLWSSGTTGPPKGIVHGQGGMLLEHLKVGHLQLDARPGDRVFWFTTTGWMMWNLLVGTLATGAAVVCFDGDPGHPDLNRLWDLADAEDVTLFGTSAAFVAACAQQGIEPRAGRALTRLRTVGSTGSPLSPASFDWLAAQLGPGVAPVSVSGGSDLCTAFLGGDPTVPVRRGELQGRALGAAVQAWGADGRPVPPGEVGDLVITRPMPSMPLWLWGDADGSRLRETYFEPWPGVWRHGDWLSLTEDGGAIVHGRSDATINRGGVRIGTGEVYAAVLAEPGVRDALVVDVREPGTEGRLVLFVVLAHGTALDDALRGALRARLRADASPRHVPDLIVAAPDLPRTRTGKLVEVPVKRLLEGGDPDTVVSRGSLVNPAAFEWFSTHAAPLLARPA